MTTNRGGIERELADAMDVWAKATEAREAAQAAANNAVRLVGELNLGPRQAGDRSRMDRALSALAVTGMLATYAELAELEARERFEALAYFKQTASTLLPSGSSANAA